jgi:hypothetical protein
MLSFLIPETVDMTLEKLGEGKMSPRNRWLHMSKWIELVGVNHTGSEEHDGNGLEPGSSNAEAISMRPPNLDNQQAILDGEDRPKTGEVRINTV